MEEKLIARLESLLNEIEAVLGIAERKMRAAAGHTNINVLRLKMDEAREVLKEAKGQQ